MKKARFWPMDQRLAFWHPVLRASELKGRPCPVAVCGVPIVLYRTEQGEMAALYDRCAHRRAPLSEGWVQDASIVCPYHACSFSVDGAGHCPTTNSSRFQVPAFETRELHGVIWVRSADIAASNPLCGPDTGINPGFDEYDANFAGVVSLNIAAPLQLVVDNMTELEHTGAVHKNLAFGVEDYDRVETSCERQGDKISIFYRGPQRPVPFYLMAAAGIRRGDTYSQTAEVSFNPPSALYHIWWTAQARKTLRPFELRFVVYYTPIDADNTRLFAFVFWGATGRLRRAAMHLAQPFLRMTVARELKQDKQIIEKLPLDEATIDMFQLSRFDRPLVLTRKLMATHYAPGTAVRGEGNAEREPLMDCAEGARP